MQKKLPILKKNPKVNESKVVDAYRGKRPTFDQAYDEAVAEGIDFSLGSEDRLPLDKLHALAELKKKYKYNYQGMSSGGSNYQFYKKLQRIGIKRGDINY